MRQLSLHHGYGPSTLHSALHRPWPKAEKLIADALGTAPEKIWPSRYQPKRSVAEVLSELRNTSQFSAVNDTDESHISPSKAVA
jgi:lambda repressor-like predicted transcriptional regulator